MIDRALAERVFHEAVAKCDPERVVAAAIAKDPLLARGRVTRARTPSSSPDAILVGARPVVLEGDPMRATPGTGRVLAIAIGKAALAMARGAGEVVRGIAVTIADDNRVLPRGWRVMIAGHPHADARSVEAGQAVQELVASATDRDLVLALVSGGASALVEAPRGSLDELRAVTVALMAAGAPIDELNALRAALSTIKAGQLAASCAAPIHSYVASDVIGDRLEVIGSGPTIGPWLAAPGESVSLDLEPVRRRALAILDRYGIAVPAALDLPSATLRVAARSGGAGPIDPRAAEPTAGTPLAQVFGSRIVARDDRAELVLAMRTFADATREILAANGVRANVIDEPVAGEPDAIAEQLARTTGAIVAWGEPTPRVPADHGTGGRAQHLALALAKRLRGGERAAFVAGTDGIDGPPTPDRPSPAGAFVDGTTWDAIIAAGVDPEHALARCDAGTALAAVGALFTPGPTGINHADVIVVA